MTVFPCGVPVPTASSLNYVAGDVVPNELIVQVGAGGSICAYTYAGTHLLVDVVGWVPPGSGYSPMVPARVVDTRPGSSTVDGVLAGVGARSAGSVLEVPVAGRAGVPVDASAVVVNVTAVEPGGGGS